MKSSLFWQWQFEACIICILYCLPLPCRQVASGDSVMSVKLRATLKRIAENLIMSGSEMASYDELSNTSSSSGSGGGVAGMDSATDDRIPHPHISPAVDLHRPDMLFGLVERVVATESLWAFHLYLTLIAWLIYSFIPVSCTKFWGKFVQLLANLHWIKELHFIWCKTAETRARKHLRRAKLLHFVELFGY